MVSKLGYFYMLGVLERLVFLSMFFSFVLTHSYCPWKQLYPCKSCFSSLSGGTIAAFCRRAGEAIAFWVLCLRSSWIIKFSSLTLEHRNYSQPCLHLRIGLSFPYVEFFPWLPTVSSLPCTDRDLAEISRGTHHRSPTLHLSVCIASALFSLALWLTNLNHLGLPWPSTCLLNLGNSQAPHPELWPANCPRQWARHPWGYLGSLPLSGIRGHGSELPAAQYFKAVILYILCCFSDFKCEDKPVPISSSCQ